MRRSLLLSLAAGLALSSCGSIGNTSAPLPTVVLDGGMATTQAPATGAGEGVTATGVLVAARQATLAFTFGGSVRSVAVEVGDPVQAGQVLVELENSALQAQVEIARRALREMTSVAAVAAAEQAFANAEKALADAEYRWRVQQQGYRASSETIRDAEAKLLLAEDEVARYKGLYDSASGDSAKALALVNLTAAQQRRDAALRNLNWYKGKPSDTDQAILDAEVAVVKAALQEAEWYLAAVRGEAVSKEASGAGLTKLQNARDALAAAEAALNGSRLVAPFSGTLAVLNVGVGDYVLPGVPAAIVVDLSRLLAETTDLSELDVTRVAVGDKCFVGVKALAQEAEGHVLRVALLPTTLGGDVVYAVTVELDSLPDRVRPGMTAEVTCQASP